MILVEKHNFGDTREIEMILDPGQYRDNDGTFVVHEKVHIMAVQEWTKSYDSWRGDGWITRTYRKETARPYVPPPPPPPKPEPPHPTSRWHRFWCDRCSDLPKAQVVK